VQQRAPGRTGRGQHQAGGVVGLHEG
jgi:hypothetical protein